VFAATLVPARVCFLLEGPSLVTDTYHLVRLNGVIEHISYLITNDLAFESARDSSQIQYVGSIDRSGASLSFF